MPSYGCGSSSIRLSLVDLSLSTSTKPINQPGQENATHLKGISKHFPNSLSQNPLIERPIYTEEEIPSRIRFLGAHNTVPFIMTIASKDTCDPSAFGSRTEISHYHSLSDTLQNKIPSPDFDESGSHLSTLSSPSDIPTDDEISLLNLKKEDSNGKVYPFYNFDTLITQG